MRLELQADCYAGLWVGKALDTGFIEEITRQDVADALDAAAAVGDDRIQERTQGRVTPESWTHGSAEQRQSWFVRGIEASGPQGCDTFSGPRLSATRRRVSEPVEPARGRRLLPTPPSACLRADADRRPPPVDVPGGVRDGDDDRRPARLGRAPRDHARAGVEPQAVGQRRRS